MSNGPFLLDTDVASFVIKANNPSLNTKFRFTPVSRIFVSVISAAEMLYGVRAFRLDHRRHQDVATFLATIQLLPWDLSAAEAYADIRHTLTTSGQLIGELDMMIAAHALARSCILVTNNTRHFARLAPPLQIENWAEST